MSGAERFETAALREAPSPVKLGALPDATKAKRLARHGKHPAISLATDCHHDFSDDEGVQTVAVGGQSDQF